MPARLAPVEPACLLAPRDPLLQLLPVAECVSVCVCACVCECGGGGGGDMQSCSETAHKN